MGSNRIGEGYRKLDSGVRRTRRRAHSVRRAVHETLMDSLGLRLAVYAVLLLAAVGSVIHMADVNAAARPGRDMKWYMRPGAVQVAAPPMSGATFEEAEEDEAESEVPEEWRDIEEESSDDEEPAERESLASGFFSLFPRALAEEAPNAAELPEDALAADDDGWVDAEDLEDAAAPEEAGDAAKEPDAAAEPADDPDGDDDLESLDDSETPEEGEEGSGSFDVAPGLIIWDDEPAQAGETPEPTAKTGESKAVKLVISAAGDCTLGGDVRTGGLKRFDSVVKKKGYDYFLSKVKGVFAKDDLTIVNLEGPLTSSKKIRVRKMYTFRGKPDYAKILKAGSVEICNIANNHALDFDVKGLKDTVKVLDKAGIGTSGFGKVYTTRVKGVKVCSMGFTKWQYSARDIYKAVKAQRKKCDLLIVSIHWGEEGVYKTSREQRLMGRAAIEAGADLVLGHHPHVFGGIEQYKGKYIVYSLSNFCFGGNRNPSDKRTFIFQQTFSIRKGKVKDAGINIVPCAVTMSRKGNDYRPAPMPKKRALLLMKNIAKYSSVKWSKVKWMDGAVPVKLGLVKQKKKK